jgi:hypothetical protein
MAKKDLSLGEDTDRDGKEKSGSDKREDTKNTGEEKIPAQTIVKNASATGLGAMGRNDQDQADEIQKSDPYR